MICSSLGTVRWTLFDRRAGRPYDPIVQRSVRPLAAHRHPAIVAFVIPGIAEASTAAASELRERALIDRDRCCGYFPSLAGAPGIHVDLPACAEFAIRLPEIRSAGAVYRFNFLRLSLVRQSSVPAYHLDSDADTAITGDVARLGERRILRLLLNLHQRSDRAVHYIDVDPSSVALAAQGSYLCVAEPAAVRSHARVLTIPRRRDATVHGAAFASNLVLHAGVDDAEGHFVAAYGIDAAA